jgi:hypothetical protein
MAYSKTFSGRTVKFKKNMRGVDIIQTVYAFLMGLGLREAFLASYEIYLKWESLDWHQIILPALLFFNIILLSVRFFWVPRNFRYLYFCAEQNKFHLEPDKAPLSSFETSVHVFIILIHSLLYFLLCRQFGYFTFVSIRYESGSQGALTSYVFLHASLLIFNAVWLIYVNWKETDLQSKFKIDPQERFHNLNSESKFWFRNNLFFSLLAVAPLAAFASCSSELLACISQAFSAKPPPFPVIPTSTFNIALVFDYIFKGVTKPDFFLAIWALGALMINSVIDLSFTAHYYVNLEEVEEEASYQITLLK